MITKWAVLVAGVGVLLLGAAVSSEVLSFSAAEFSYPTIDSRSVMSYRCEQMETREASEANARSAHAFFEENLLEISQQQAVAMSASMFPNRTPSEVIPELEKTNATADALRREAARELERRFGCKYLGGI
ncbi:hypothetical protein [Pseudotabrizicola sp. L79]|uniref:hypothetical protein n=1 Tax=Pseudotabrizicola sp. L79 TaxID=3118402 RepID=UPI002F9289F4